MEIKSRFEEQEKQDLQEFQAGLTPAEKSERKWILIAALGSLFSINTLILSAEAVLPTYIDHTHHDYIDGGKTALIIAATEVGCLISSPIIGSLMEKIGRKNCACIGFLFLVRYL